MRTKTKPSHYPSLPFLAIRGVSLLSALIVTSIIAYFSHQLYSDSFKIPWTFIIVILASGISLIVLILTSIIQCCATLAPIFNLLLNVPLLIAWLFALCLLSYNMYGTLGHSCSIDNWASDDGVMVCQTYKALYAFTFIGTLFHIAQIVLDVRARREQVGRGKYDKMNDSTQDIKIDTLPPSALHSTSNVNSTGSNSIHDVPLAQDQHFMDEPTGWRPGQKQNTTSSASAYDRSHSYESREQQPQYHHHHQQQQCQQPQQYHSSSSTVNMDDFRYQHSLPQQTHYDSGNYALNNNPYHQQHYGGSGYQAYNQRY